jgi:hypothetical protein
MQQKSNFCPELGSVGTKIKMKQNLSNMDL